MPKSEALGLRFDSVQKDIERYLSSVGKRSRTPTGMIVFRGYDDALRIVFAQYLQHGALAPLVTHFHKWNWEYSYNTFLFELTDALSAEGNWPQLQRLWDGVVAKRRKLYNDLLKLRKQDHATAVPPETLVQARERLLDALNRVRELSVNHGTANDTSEYSRLIENVDAGRRA
jgi:hypothetical protein